MGEPAQEGTMSAKKSTRKSAKSTTATNKKSKGFTDEDRAATKERAQELKTDARRGAKKDKADGEGDVLAKIAEMPKPDRAMAKRLHAIVKASAPVLSPKTWYGMPAYAKDGKVVCFFQSAQKFKSRYATFGFSDEANPDGRRSGRSQMGTNGHQGHQGHPTGSRAGWTALARRARNPSGCSTIRGRERRDSNPRPPA